MNKMDGDYFAVVSYYYICDVSANPLQVVGSLPKQNTHIGTSLLRNSTCNDI